MWASSDALLRCNGEVGFSPRASVVATPTVNTPIAVQQHRTARHLPGCLFIHAGRPRTLSGNAVAINFGGYSILGLTATLQYSSFAVVGTDSTPDTGFNFVCLPSGTYALNLLGFATGSSGGFYAGGFIAETIPTVVPEPQAYALMLAGLGIVGFAVRRRRA